MPHAAGEGGGRLGNIGQFGRGGTLIDRGVGHEHCMVLPDNNVDAQRRRAFGIVQHAADFAHRLRKAARHTRDHRIGFTHLQQERSEDVAVLIDQPFAFPAQIAATLEAFIEHVDHLGDEG